MAITIKGISLNDFAREVHVNAVKHGWWEQEAPFAQIIALCHAELSEALEEEREGNPSIYYICPDDGQKCKCDGKTTRCGWEDEMPDACKADGPQGKVIELVDCILRILDYCNKEGIDIEQALEIKHEYNQGRPYKHGGKAF